MSEPPHLIVRPPRPDEADAVADLHNRSWRETYADRLPERFYDDAALERRRALWAKTFERPHAAARVRVAELDGVLVGLASAGTSREANPARSTQLNMLYVLTAHHGSEVAQKLLDEVLGDSPAQVWVARDNPRAHSLYRRNGFRPDGAEKTEPRAGNLPEVRLVR